MDHEAADACRYAHEIDRRAESASLAEHHIAVAGLVARARRRSGTVGMAGPDDEVVEAVAVHVTGGGNRHARVIGNIRAVDHEAASTESDVTEIDRSAESASVAEHHITAASIDARAGRRTGTVGRVGADDEVVEAVTVHVTGGGDRIAGPIIRIRAVDHEAANPRSNVHEINGRRKARPAAEHHVAVTGTGARARRRAGTVGQVGPDDDVVEAVAIDVPGGGHRSAGAIVRIRAVDDEAANPRSNVHEINGRRKARPAAEHHIAVAGIGARARCRAGTVGKRCPDDDVVEAVAIDVPGGGHRKAGPIVRIHALDHEAANPRSNVHEINGRRKARLAAEHHIAVAGLQTRARCRAGTVGKYRPDDEVVEAVAIDVPGGGHRKAGQVEFINPVDHEAAGSKRRKIDGHGATPVVK